MIDSKGVLKVINQLQTAAHSVDNKQSEIVGKLVDQFIDIPHESRMAILDETTKTFPKEDKKPGGKNYSAYQYSVRLKAVIGAKFLVPKFEIAGNVNVMYSNAVKALKENGLNFRGEKVEEMKAKAEEEKAIQARKDALYIASQNMPQATMEQLGEMVKERITAQQAEDMLKRVQTAAEKFAERMIKGNGRDYAVEFATHLLAQVRKAEVKETAQA